MGTELQSFLCKDIVYRCPLKPVSLWLASSVHTKGKHSYSILSKKLNASSQVLSSNYYKSKAQREQ